MEVKVFINDNVAVSNCYILIEDGKCYVVDPGGYEMTEVINYIEENNLVLEGILQTHGHFDHILGIPAMVKYKDVPVFISENGYDFLYDPTLSLSMYGYKNFVIPKEVNVVKVKENDVIFGFRIMETPGHSSGCVCFYREDDRMLITGDVLFKGTYGRLDLPTGNSADMWKTLQRLMQLPADTTVYPGHGLTTTIGAEKRNYLF